MESTNTTPAELMQSKRSSHPDVAAENEKDIAAESENNDDAPITVTRTQLYMGWFAADLLLYVIVLNLAAEFVATITIDRFSISLFVAVFLKAFIDLIHVIEHKIRDFFCVRLGRKFIGAFVMWLVVFSSKFVILWVDDIIFGRHIDLGYVWEVIILSIVLMVVSQGTHFVVRQLLSETSDMDRFLLRWLGKEPPLI